MKKRVGILVAILLGLIVSLFFFDKFYRVRGFGGVVSSGIRYHLLVSRLGLSEISRYKTVTITMLKNPDKNADVVVHGVDSKLIETITSRLNSNKDGVDIKVYIDAAALKEMRQSLNFGLLTK